MSIKTRYVTLFFGAFAFLLVLAAALSTCKSPLGFGDSIDWEPPVLTIEPVPPNPYYVRQGTVLRGVVTDNVSVDRVIMRLADTGEELQRATLTSGDGSNSTNNRNWEIALDFTEEQNGEKLAVEIIAFDRSGNTGDNSFVSLTLVIDIGPPLIEDIWIQRTNVRKADLEPYSTLKYLETSDRLAERSENMDRYQNGAFHISAVLAESETKIEIVSLNIYDFRDPNTPLLVLERDDDLNSTAYKPRWLIEEDRLLAAGEAMLPGYTNSYYNGGERYYYRVVVIAYDRSDNESEYNENIHQEDIRVEEQGFFCMWERADIPKGIIDPLVGGISDTIYVTKGATLPVEFFDDDQLEWAYTGLLTIEQWRGDKPIGDDGLSIIAGTNEEKKEWLKNQIRIPGKNIYDWRKDRYSAQDAVVNAGLIKDLATGAINQVTPYVQTGNQDQDNGEYVLFSFVADKKLSPHTQKGNTATFRTRERLEFWYVNVIDENEPLIVFDTVNTKLPSYVADINGAQSNHPGGPVKEIIPAARTGDSPEENTFPILTSGRYFEINGYTLRANKTTVAENMHNTVIYFRLAWIPAKHGDSLVSQVQTALRAENYPSSMDNLEAQGVQHWAFIPLGGTKGSEDLDLTKGTNQTLDDTNTDDIFTKQVFRKKFDVLGGKDDTKDAYFNFRPDGEDGDLENDTKLFVFYAEDNMGHAVFRQLRLLGNRTPPEMTIYDLTNRDVEFSMDYTLTTPQLPNMNNSNSAQTNYYFFNSLGYIDDAGRQKYRRALLAYQGEGYSKLRGIAMPSDSISEGLSIAESNAAYPRETIVKYWVTAKSNGSLDVRDIQMRDITFQTSAPYNAGSYLGRVYDGDSAWSQSDPVPTYVGTNVPYPNDLSLSYVEMLPEVTQRVFMFTATDSLGNTANVQRTLAVTNAAILNNITTTTQNGTYGIGTTITLKANFSNLVEWTGTNPPLLNISHSRNANTGTPNGTEVIRQIATTTPANTPTLSLDFVLTVEEGHAGTIATMYGDLLSTTYAGITITPSNAVVDRPITIPSGTQILDSARGDPAFTPGNVAGFNWTSAGRGHASSIQGTKEIKLQGVRPERTGFTLTAPAGKTYYTAAPTGFFYRADETIEFVVTANKSIFTSATTAPMIQFQIANNATWFNAAWARSSSSVMSPPADQAGNQMVFSVIVASQMLSGNNNAPVTAPDGQITAIRINNASSIVDNVGNAFVSGSNPITLTNTPPAGSQTNASIRIDKTAPAVPSVTLPGGVLNGTEYNGAIGGGTAAGNTLFYNASPRLNISDTTNEPSPVIEYSLNSGVTWVTFPNPQTNWTNNTGIVNGLNVENGEWTLQARMTDRAGNVGAVLSQAIHVNSRFPGVLSITAGNPNGYYKAGDSLSFAVSFDGPVWTSNTDNVTITLTNRSASNTHKSTGGGVNPSFQRELTATAIPNTAASTTLNFAWPNIQGKEMLNGLYVSAVNFTGLRDRFGTAGGTGTAAATGSPVVIGQVAITRPGYSPVGSETNPYNVANLAGEDLKVDCLVPVLNNTTPRNAYNRANSNITDAIMPEANTVIKLNFDEPMQKGRGTITIKPSGQYLIPPVFENDGYYLNDATGARSANYSSGLTRVDGFFDIYNSSLLDETDRNRLTRGTNMSNGLILNARTGQNEGPYIRMTQGLMTGTGYTGSYNNTTPGANGPNPAQAGSLVPDTSTKWVLDYRYSIDGNANTWYVPANGTPNPNPVNAATNTNATTYSANGQTTNPTVNDTQVVTNIRNTLTKAKFRWQEVDVTAGNVTFEDNNRTVVITLSEPLLRGLKWDLCYDGGTFTDAAGNNAAAVNYTSGTIVGQGATASNYWFWSYGVRAPVIRVNRKSYDARTGNWWNTTRTYSNPTNLTGTDNGPAGWGIENFNTVHYRIETETPDARLYYGTQNGRAAVSGTLTIGSMSVLANANNNAGINATWDNAVDGGGVITGTTARNWNDDHSSATPENGIWVRPNLIRRAANLNGANNGTTGSYTVTENGQSVTRTFRGRPRVLRSYNKDAESVTLGALNLPNEIQSSISSGTALNFTYNSTEASKNYVVAIARVNHNNRANWTAAVPVGQESGRGYEGVFRSVVALWQGSNDGTNTNQAGIVVEGSNVKNGMPSIAGFPVRDAEETGDNRFIKMFYRGTTSNHQFYWVSTEIVSDWYFIKWGGQGSHMQDGEVNNYLSAGYGDLSFGYSVRGFN